MTCRKSSDSVMPCTDPISTSFYLTFVLPASMPSALLKVTVTTGPFSATDLTTSATPINAEMSGTSQIRDGSQRLRGLSSGLERLERCIVQNSVSGFPVCGEGSGQRFIVHRRGEYAVQRCPR